MNEIEQKPESQPGVDHATPCPLGDACSHCGGTEWVCAEAALPLIDAAARWRDAHRHASAKSAHLAYLAHEGGHDCAGIAERNSELFAEVQTLRVKVREANAARALLALRIARQRAEIGKLVKERRAQILRCEVCGWPLAESVKKGCVPGNCSYRPPDGSEEHRRIKARRAELAARKESAGA